MMRAKLGARGFDTPIVMLPTFGGRAASSKTMMEMDWTMANMKDRRAESPRTASDEAPSVCNAPVLTGEASSPAPIGAPLPEPGNTQLIQSHALEDFPLVQSPQPVGEPTLATGAHGIPSSGSSVSVALDASQAAAPSQIDQHAALRKAVLSSGVNAEKTDRSRAIDLRWVLRDVRAKRTKWWPVSDQDQLILIEIGLVEMRDDDPILTNLGLDAIA